MGTCRCSCFSFCHPRRGSASRAPQNRVAHPFGVSSRKGGVSGKARPLSPKTRTTRVPPISRTWRSGFTTESSAQHSARSHHIDRVTYCRGNLSLIDFCSEAIQVEVCPSGDSDCYWIWGLRSRLVARVAIAPRGKSFHEARSVIAANVFGDLHNVRYRSLALA
jgi:hypothetical protein